MNKDEQAREFITRCRAVADDVMYLSGQDNLLCRKVDCVEIIQAQGATILTSEQDTCGNLITEVLFTAINSHQPWCMVSLQHEDHQPLMLAANHCVLTLQRYDDLNKLIISPNYGWEDEVVAATTGEIALGISGR